jgi:hypothetical protein
MNKGNVNYLLFLIALLFVTSCTDRPNNWIPQHNEYSDQWKINVENGFSLNAIYADGKGKVYAVGSLGVIFSRVNNQPWKNEDNYWGNVDFNTIYGKDDEVWAIGEKGAILHKKENSSWVKEASDAGNSSLNAIYKQNDDVWAVGREGTIVHKKGNEPWKREQIDGFNDFRFIYSHGNDIRTIDRSGTIFFKKGNEPWKKETSGFGEVYLSAIWEQGDDLWAVGSYGVGMDFGAILHKRGNEGWKISADTSYNSFKAIYGRGDDLWILGSNGIILHKKGNGSWTKEVSNAGNETLTAIYGRDDDIWAIGDSGIIIHKKGNGVWVREESYADSCNLMAISGQDNDIWAVGENGTILHKKDNEPWIKTESIASSGSSFDNTIYSLYGQGNEMWATGFLGTIFHKKNNGPWKKEDEGKSNISLGAFYSRGTDIWVVGDGTIVHKKSDGPWKKEKGIPESLTLKAIYGHGDDIWAIGSTRYLITYNGAILHKKGNGPWENEESDASNRSLNAMYGRDDDLWIIGDSGTILHNNGEGRWVKEESNAGSSRLISIYGQEDDIWVAGERGTILHKKGSGPWKKEEFNDDEIHLFSIYAQGDDVWTIGEVGQGGNWGTIFHKKGNGSWKKEKSNACDAIISIIGYNKTVFIPCREGFLYKKGENSWVFFQNNFEYYKCIEFDNHIYCIVNNGSGILRLSPIENKYPIIDKYKYHLSPVIKPDQLTLNVDIKLPERQSFDDLGDVSLVLEAKVYDELQREVSDSGYHMVNADFKLEDSSSNTRTYSISFEIAKTYRIVLGAERANKLCLRVKVLSQLWNFEETFKLSDSKGNYYLTLNNDYWEKNKNWILIVLAVVLYYLFWLILWAFFPLLFLKIHGSDFFQRLASLSPPFDQLLSLLNILIPASILSRTNHVLDAWVKLNKSKLSEKFENSNTVKSKSIYVQLPIRINDPINSPSMDKPDEKLLYKLFDKKRTIIQIIGDGGKGKTTLAVRIARWLIQEGNKRGAARFVRIPILLETDTTDLGKTVKELLISWLAIDVIPDSFIRALLKKQRLVIITDALSERKAETQEYFKNIHGKLPANALIITTRTKMDMQVREGTDVYPMPLSSENLVHFITTYLAASENNPLKKAEDQLEFAKKTVEIIKSNNLDSEITPILVALIIDNALEDYDPEKKSFGVVIKEMPGSIPEVYSQYLKRNNPSNEFVKNYLEENQMLSIAEIMGELSLENNYVPKEFEESALKMMLSRKHPGLTSDPVQRFIDNGIISKRPSGNKYYLRFDLDPLAEYLAASKAYDDVKGDRTKMKELISKVKKLGNDANGFKTAFEQIVEFKKKFG